ncbi:MAG TPA: imidazole glycerol phosphate synthase subunit HisH, partial [Chitinophagaceae bacterium]
MTISIIKYNAGNIQSVLFALERLGATATVTDDPVSISAADKVIFPGVGEASSAMAYLRERKLDRLITGLKQPVLGICLGMQLMCRRSSENATTCLGIFEEDVSKFEPADTRLKVPQIGWNNIQALSGPLFNNVEEGAFCYFVHSYYASIGDHTIATTDYGGLYSASLNRENFYGVQFHPEKSA